jgi:hypothetical protein
MDEKTLLTNVRKRDRIKEPGNKRRFGLLLSRSSKGV